MVTLAINPGGGSTRIGIYRNLRPLFEQTVRHSSKELRRCPSVLDQLGLRRDALRAALQRIDSRRQGIDRASGAKPPVAGPTIRGFTLNTRPNIEAIVSRGGTLKPLPGGIYRITEAVVADIKAGNVQTMHPSVLGPLLAWEIGQERNVPAWFVDPESIDEFWPVSRLTGLPEIPRRALSHALSVKAVAKAAATRLGRRYDRCNFVVAHLGTGITVAAHRLGRQVDSSNANEDGPLAPQRAGALPTEGLVDYVLRQAMETAPEMKPRRHEVHEEMNPGGGPPFSCLSCFRGSYGGLRSAVLDRLQRNGGLLAWLGTDDIREVEKRIDSGDEPARLVYDAMVYQIAKEIGAYAAVLKGRADAIVLTGGLTLSRRLVRALKAWVRRLAPRIIVFPGEREMEALVSAVLRLSRGLEKEQIYG